jgi:hypothetical protein
VKGFFFAFPILFAVPACAPEPLTPPAAAPAPSAVTVQTQPALGISAPLPEPPAGDVYLPRERANGSPYCFDPDSRTLRRFVKAPRHEEGDALDARLLAADVHDLHEAMRKVYAGYAVLEEDPSFDVDGFFADWEASVRAAGTSITFAEGVIRPLVVLRHHIRDNHLFVAGWARRLTQREDLAFSEYQTRQHVDGFGPACSFTGAQPVAGTTRYAKLLSRSGLSDLTTFSAQSTVPSVDVTCAGRTAKFERRVSKAKGSPDGAPIFESRKLGQTTILTVREMSGSPQALAQLERLDTEYDSQRTSSMLVFDFRGNGGGNDSYVFKWIDEAKRGPWPIPHFDVHLSGAERACGAWNDLVADQIEYQRVDTPEAKAERDAFVARQPLGDAHGALTESPMTAVTMSSNAKSPYRGKIYAILDGASASSGETSPDTLRTALGATVVGERSAGFLELGNVYPYMMPRTGVLWELASKRSYYTEPHDGVGVPVDVYLDEDLIGAPVEQIAPLLEKLPRDYRAPTR